jgi:hypothetical protein
MAGPSKTYWRTDQPLTPVERVRINSYGRPETYNEWDFYQVNHRIGSHQMNEHGVCVSNTGMDDEYYSNGPEHGLGGPQLSDHK